MPPSISMEATTTRIVSGSDSMATPPSATSAGIDNCTVAAWVAGNPRSARYHAI